MSNGLLQALMGPELKYKIKQNKPSTKLCVSLSKSQTYVTIDSSLWNLIFHQNIILCICLGKASLEYLLHIVDLFFKNQLLLLLFQMRLIAGFFFLIPLMFFWRPRSHPVMSLSVLSTDSFPNHVNSLYRSSHFYSHIAYHSSKDCFTQFSFFSHLSFLS